MNDTSPDHGVKPSVDAHAVRSAATLAKKNKIAILPPKEDGTKAPDTPEWKRRQSEPPSQADFERWYGADQRPTGRTGLGMVTGSVSGNVVCLEFDRHGTLYEAFKARASECGLGDLVERIEAGYSERTPSGGIHLLIRTEKFGGNTVLAKYLSDEVNERTGKQIVKPSIETREEGGFVILAPSGGSVHPTGKPYELLRGGFDTIAGVATDEWEALRELARSFNEVFDAAVVPSEEKARKKAKPKVSNDPNWPSLTSTIDDYNDRGPGWNDFLTSRGWTLVRVGGDTQYWRRPGKDRGISATVNRDGHNRLYVFSGSTEFETERPYDKFAAFQLLSHNGDFKAALKAASEAGYGTHPREVLEDGKVVIRAFPNPCPKGKRIAKPQDVRQTRQICVSATGEIRDLGSPEQKPQIIISSNEKGANDQAISVLASIESVHTRVGMLATVQRFGDGNGDEGGDGVAPNRRITVGTPRIVALKAPTVRELLASHIDWVKIKQTKDGGTQPVRVHPPDWCVPAVLARPEYRGFREITGISESPYLAPNGQIWDTPGYNPATGILYEPNDKFLPVKHHPTHADAKAAAELFFDLVVDYRFARAAHRASFLSGVITPFARPRIQGPVPAHAALARQAGSGKNILWDMAAVIRTGREMSRTDFPSENAELRKIITSICMAGYETALFDNVDTYFGGSAIDAALTAKYWTDRLLGKNELTDLPIRTAWYVTGNNISLRGDMMRRLIVCMIESSVEKPEERSGFRYPDLVGHVKANRPKYVHAALTILRAYAVAGWPDQDLRKMGSYDEWSKVVRGAISWATGLDPYEAREGLELADETAATATSVIQGWDELPNAERGMTVTEMLKLLKGNPDHFDTLREALMTWSRNEDLPPPKIVGNRLKAIQGRIVGTRRLMARSGRGGILVWYIGSVLQELEKDKKGGSGCSGGSSLNPTRENGKTQTDNKEDDFRDGSKAENHQSNQTHRLSLLSIPDSETIESQKSQFLSSSNIQATQIDGEWRVTL